MKNSVNTNAVHLAIKFAKAKNNWPSLELKVRGDDKMELYSDLGLMVSSNNVSDLIAFLSGVLGAVKMTEVNETHR